MTTIDSVATIEGGLTTGVISDRSLDCSTADLISCDKKHFWCYLCIADTGETSEEIAR